MKKPFFSKEDGGDWAKLPKIGGEDVTLKLERYQRVDMENSEDNFKSPKKNWGFHYVVYTDKGKFILNTWKLYYAMEEIGAGEGDTVVFSHPERGVWKLKLVTNPDVETTNGNLDYLKEIEKRNAPEEDAWDE